MENKTSQQMFFFFFFSCFVFLDDFEHWTEMLHRENRSHLPAWPRWGGGFHISWWWSRWTAEWWVCGPVAARCAGTRAWAAPGSGSGPSSRWPCSSPSNVQIPWECKTNKHTHKAWWVMLGSTQDTKQQQQTNLFCSNTLWINSYKVTLPCCPFPFSPTRCHVWELKIVSGDLSSENEPNIRWWLLHTDWDRSTDPL